MIGEAHDNRDLPPSGLGQDLWGQSIHSGGYPFAQQYGQQPFGTQAFAPQQQFGQQPFGQQILAVLPALITQQAQQLYAIAQMCAQLTSGLGYQVGLPQAGQRPYPIGF
jgi:hypothetical protein